MAGRDGEGLERLGSHHLNADLIPSKGREKERKRGVEACWLAKPRHSAKPLRVSVLGPCHRHCPVCYLLVSQRPLSGHSHVSWEWASLVCLPHQPLAGSSPRGSVPPAETPWWISEHSAWVPRSIMLPAAIWEVHCYGHHSIHDPSCDNSPHLFLEISSFPALTPHAQAWDSWSITGPGHIDSMNKAWVNWRFVLQRPNSSSSLPP